MDLWIRCPDKTVLHKVDNIAMDNDNYTLYSQTSYGQVRLGQYKTKERAIEVLDEIQKYILLPNIDNSNYVYEMPNE